MAYLSYQSIKTFKSSHVRSAAFTRGLLITLCVVFYAIFLMSSCSNKELRPRFLQGFSILIFGLMLCGCLLTIPCAIGFVLSRVGKHRQKDLWLHLDCIFYVCVSYVFPTFVVSLILWGNSKVLKDLINSDGNIVTYEGSCPGVIDWSNNSTSNITILEHVCQYWDTKDLEWSSKGCQTIVADATTNSGNSMNNFTTSIACQCNHLTEFAVTLKKSKNRFAQIFSKPLDALNVHWLVPFTLAIIFSVYIVCTIACAFWDVYVGRRLKMKARGFITVLAYIRMRRHMNRQRWSRLSEHDRRSGRFSQNFAVVSDVNKE